MTHVSSGYSGASDRGHSGRTARVFRPVQGRVYRTADLARYSANPSRLAKRLVDRGVLTVIAGGMYGVPKRSAFGPLTPSTSEILAAFLKHTPYVMTGPEYWNATGLGSTSVFPLQMVYNEKRSGKMELGGRRFWFVRKAFPKHPTPEWYVVDLLENRDTAGVAIEELRAGLQGAVRQGRLDPERLLHAATEWGTKLITMFVREALQELSPAIR